MKHAIITTVALLALIQCNLAPAYNHTDPALPGTDDTTGACQLWADRAGDIIRERYKGRSRIEALERGYAEARTERQRQELEYLVARMYAAPLTHVWSMESLEYAVTHVEQSMERECHNLYQYGGY